METNGILSIMVFHIILCFELLNWNSIEILIIDALNTPTSSTELCIILIFGFAGPYHKPLSHGLIDRIAAVSKHCEFLHFGFPFNI